MTTELEKQFFDTFGIEPKQTCGRAGVCNNYVNYNDCNGCNSYKYPQITDRILLELICIYSRISNLAICVDEVEELKESILIQFIENSEDFKQQVQALFKGE